MTLVPTLCVGMQTGRSASPLYLPGDVAQRSLVDYPATQRVGASRQLSVIVYHPATQSVGEAFPRRAWERANDYPATQSVAHGIPTQSVGTSNHEYHP